MTGVQTCALPIYSPTGAFVPSLSYSFLGYDVATRTAKFAMASNMESLAVTVPTDGIVSSQSFDASTWILSVVLVADVRVGVHSLVAKGVGYSPGTTISYTAYKVMTFDLVIEVVPPGKDVGYNFKVIWNPRVGSNSGSLSVLYNLNGGVWYTLIPGVDYTAVLTVDTVVGGADTDYSLSYSGMINTCSIISTVVDGSDKYKVIISVVDPVSKSLSFYFYMDKAQQTIYDEFGTPIEDIEGTTENWLSKIANYLRDIVDLLKGLLSLILAVVQVVGASFLLLVSAFGAFISFLAGLVGTFIVQITSFTYSYISVGSLGLTFPSSSLFPIISITSIDTVLEWVCLHISRASNLQLIWGTVALFGFINRYILSVPIVDERLSQNGPDSPME